MRRVAAERCSKAEMMKGYTFSFTDKLEAWFTLPTFANAAYRHISIHAVHKFLKNAV